MDQREDKSMLILAAVRTGAENLRRHVKTDRQHFMLIFISIQLLLHSRSLQEEDKTTGRRSLQDKCSHVEMIIGSASVSAMNWVLVKIS